jgi:hypothetical protein
VITTPARSASSTVCRAAAAFNANRFIADDWYASLDEIVRYRGVRRSRCADRDGIHAGLGQVRDRVEQRNAGVVLGHLETPGLRPCYDAGQQATPAPRDQRRGK